MYFNSFSCTVGDINITPSDQLNQPIQRRSELPQHMQLSIGTAICIVYIFVVDGYHIALFPGHRRNSLAA